MAMLSIALKTLRAKVGGAQGLGALVVALMMLEPTSWVVAAEPSAMAQKFTPLYSQIEKNYRRSDVGVIESYGRKALRLRGPDRLYALWSVLYVYKDHMAYDRLRSWIKIAREAAISDNAPDLKAFADFFQFSLDQDNSRSADQSVADWSRFLDRSGPDIRLMALVEVVGHYVDAHQWSRAADASMAGISESDLRGARALPVKAELYQHYGYALSDMGFIEGGIEQALLASRTDQLLPLRTQDLERIYDLAVMAIDQGELDVADHLARLHFRLAKTSNGPDPQFWTRYLCASVATPRREWARVLECTKDLAPQLARPVTNRMARLLAYRAIARARLGDVAGARSDLAVLTHPPSVTVARNKTVEDLIGIYIARAEGRNAQAFEALDLWRRAQTRISDAAHRRGVSEVVAALDSELHRKRAESAQLAKAVELSRHLTVAWILIAGLLSLLIAGGLAWVIYLRRISNQLRVAGQQATAASAAKSTFLAVMSHELRTPLNGMLGMAQALQTTGLDNAQQDLVRTLRESGTALLGILNDVLDLSKIEAGGIEIVPEPGDLPAICESVISIYAFSAEARGDRLRFEAQDDLPPGLAFDALRVRQCLANLLSNAIKFTKNGVISVRLTAEPWPGGQRYRIRLEVADTGIGMSPETLQKLFGAFVQADASTTRQYGGTGLGLNIALRLAKLMGGGIDVQSLEGEGSTFTLTFFADATAEPPAPAPAETTGPSASDAFDAPLGLRVLVVDDHPVNRKVANLMLTQFGCEVHEADNGQSALTALAGQTFDIILMDVNMPVMDGREATRRIRTRAQWADLPIVALTADAGADDVAICLAAGMNTHLAKPIDAHDLWTVIVELTSDRPAPSCTGVAATDRQTVEAAP